MKKIICTRDLDYGIGSVVKYDLKKLDLDKKIDEIIVIGPKKIEGYSTKVKFEIIHNSGKFFITKEPNFAFRCNKKIKDILKKKKIDEIITHFPFYAENFGPKITYRVHGLHKSIIKNHPITFQLLISAFFHKLYSYFDYRTMKYAYKIDFVSKKTLEEAKQFYPQFEDKFHQSPNEIDKTKFFKLNEKDKIKLKKELGFDDGKKNILYVGRLEPMKGILDLIKTIQDINREEIRLIVIGDGPLKGKIVKYSFVKYLGKIPNEELHKYYNTADLFVSPSYYETGPLTVLEAIECGCPIISSNVGDSRFILFDNDIFEKKNELKNKILHKL